LGAACDFCNNGRTAWNKSNGPKALVWKVSVTSAAVTLASGATISLKPPALAMTTSIWSIPAASISLTASTGSPKAVLSILTTTRRVPAATGSVCRS
jgi:hypothetical protein